MISMSNIIIGSGRTVLTKYQVGFPLFAPFVRWRKRRWAPKAESKEFYVRQKPEQDPEEYAELTERFRPYKTYLKSLRNYLREEVKTKEAISSSEEWRKHEERLYQNLMALNKKWNEETKKIREERELRDTTAEQDEILQYTISLEKEKAQQRAAADSRVRKEQEASQYFITAENLEQEIEKALNKKVNYNFFIDLQGNRYVEKSDFSGELVSDHTDTEPHVLGQNSGTRGEGKDLASH